MKVSLINLIKLLNKASRFVKSHAINKQVKSLYKCSDASDKNRSDYKSRLQTAQDIKDKLDKRAALKLIDENKLNEKKREEASHNLDGLYKL